MVSAVTLEEVGLSMAMGAFTAAGVLLASSEYRHALEAILDPATGVAAGAVLCGVGMSIDFGTLVEIHAHSAVVGRFSRQSKSSCCGWSRAAGRTGKQARRWFTRECLLGRGR
ncbi:hypothetical protein KCP69_24775 [Salmonella enterica subsp. enterica]|nr:hypothetical protein KCP69_24775 [Salmonella enterica subsp. enterica]